MPKQIKQFKTFLSYAKGQKGSKSAPKAKTTVYIKKNKKITKFKIRRGQHLFTFKTEKPEMAKRLTDSLDTNQIEKVEIKKRIIAKKAAK